MLHIFHRSSDEDYAESSEEDDDDDEEEEEEEPLLDYKSFQKTNKKEADFWSHEAVDDVVKKYEAKELTAPRYRRATTCRSMTTPAQSRCAAESPTFQPKH